MTEEQHRNDVGSGGEPFKGRAAKRKAAAALDLIKGKTTPAQLHRQHDATPPQHKSRRRRRNAAPARGPRP